MTGQFHRKLDIMALFTALLIIGLIFFFSEFMQIACTNIFLNGIIIGTGLFGIILCFVEMFKLLPEYKWLRAYYKGKRDIPLPPRILRPVALLLHKKPKQISANVLQSLLDMITLRFEDTRETMRYTTNLLIFLGLLGTFWGLIVTVGSFGGLVSGLNFESESVLQAMQAGLSQPLWGMATAFTSSLIGLGGSLIVGFLSLQVQLAQNAIFDELEDYLSSKTKVVTAVDISSLLSGSGDNISDKGKSIASLT